MSNPLVGVFQLGARRHYVVPRLLHAAGMLAWLRTDVSSANWPVRVVRSLPDALLPASLIRLRDRRPQGIPDRLVQSFPGFGIRYSRRPAAASRSQHWVDGGKEFCRLVLKKGLGRTTAVYGFTGAALEVLQAARQSNRTAILDQIMAPRAIENRLLTQEREKYPGWEAEELSDPALDEYCDREAQEWTVADYVLCGSEFVKEGVVECGGQPARCIVMPYGAQAHAESVMADNGTKVSEQKRRLRIVVVGEVGLRKGSPYVLEAAKRLKNVAEFRLVGAVSCSSAARRDLEQNVTLTGVVPRSQVTDHLQWADVFLLPSLCEGSSGAVFEGLGAGLPVVCTRNTGSIVEHEQEGFVIPAACSESIVQSIERLASDQQLRQQMAHAAQAAARRWSMDYYGCRLIEFLRKPRGCFAVPPAEESEGY